MTKSNKPIPKNAPSKKAGQNSGGKRGNNPPRLKPVVKSMEGKYN